MLEKHDLHSILSLSGMFLIILYILTKDPNDQK